MRKRVLRRLVALIMVVFACHIAWRCLPRERLLLEYAHRVADTTQWGAGGRRFNSSIGNHWLSDKEILFDRYEGAKHDQRVIFKHNVETGQETKLDGLTASRAELEQEVISAQCTSPDGKWFLCSGRWGDCLLAEVNGTRYYIYKGEDYDHSRHLYWLPDSHHWLEEFGNSDYGDSRRREPVLHDTQYPTSGIKLPKNESTIPPGLERLLALDKAIVITWPEDKVDEFGKVIVKKDLPDQTKQVTISIVPWPKSGKPFVRYTPCLPAGVEHNDFELSPNEKHIVWQITALRPAPLQEWLHHYLPFVAAIQYKTTTVWVSNIEGSNRRELGHVLETANPSEEKDIQSDSLLEDLKWLPGGKHLSFEYKNALYVVPTDAKN